MSRLIDADKLKEVMSAKKDEYGNVAESFFNMGGELSTEWWCVEDMVDDAETVKAIPEDWIEAKIKRLKEMDNGFSCLAADILYGVLIGWRREQEGN